PAELLDRVGVLGDHLVRDRPESTDVVYLTQAPTLDDRRDRIPTLERILEGLLRARAADGPLGEHADQIHQMLGGGPPVSAPVLKTRQVLRDPVRRDRRG